MKAFGGKWKIQAKTFGGKQGLWVKTFGGKWKNNSFELPIAVTWKQMLRYKNMRGITELYTVHDEF